MTNMKMSDVFISESGEMTAGNIRKEVYQDIDHNMIDVVGKFESIEHAKYAAHAINSHDELVEQVERLELEKQQLIKLGQDTNKELRESNDTLVEQNKKLVNALASLESLAIYNNEQLHAEIKQLLSEIKGEGSEKVHE